VQHQIESKKPGDVDQQQLSALKTLIRRTEARFAAMYTGVNRDKIHHLDLPFYETGKAIKKPLGPEDVKIVKEFLQGIKPTSIYAGIY
jgi:glucosamine-6-phosphate deaminase